MSEKTEKRILIVLLIVFSMIFVHASYNIVTLLLEIKGNENSMVYSNNSKVDYSVYIKDNEFVNEKILKAGENYISSLTEKINMTLEYIYSSSEDLKLSYDYKIYATIFGFYNEIPTEGYNNPVIWKKEFSIKEIVSKNISSADNFKIKENFDIDWILFNEEVNKFKENFSIPILSRLEIKMDVNINGSNDNYAMKENKSVVAYIPLTEQVFNVDTVLNDFEEKILQSNDLSIVQNNQRQIILFSIVIVILSFLIIFTISRIVSFKANKSFHKKIDEIKKNYNEIVVETKNMINTKGLKPIAITSFDEMLNLAESLISPIMFYEEKNYACFYIVKSDVIYMFVLKNKPTKD
ncbi:MAG: DUF5305 domain-containing protein [Tenericutes bacterium]|nr:DUF5305 domain-containing protein [Mycoplasmatota bacterium]